MVSIKYIPPYMTFMWIYPVPPPLLFTWVFKKLLVIQVHNIENLYVWTNVDVQISRWSTDESRLKELRNKKLIFFLSLFDRVSWDKSNESCPAFVQYRCPTEITPQTFYFSRETAVQGSFMAQTFGQKSPNHVVFEGL